MNKLSFLVGLTLGSIISLLANCFYNYFNHSELASKSVYAAMQGIELSHRNMVYKSNGVIYLKGAIHNGEYDLLGIQTKNNQNPYCWLVSNTHNDAIPEKLYMMESCKVFHLQCDDLEGVVKKEKIDKVVEYFLESRCKSKRDVNDL